ncbi:hypothetical protein PV326_009056 [Microctonus aethiopoides]|nr:hypothetical protein PV326_009056 [Microctonus aethiopoides]
MGRQHYIPGVLYGTGAKPTVKEEIATPGPAGALRHNKAYMLVAEESSYRFTRPLEEVNEHKNFDAGAHRASIFITNAAN